ncbi:MAG TPA: NAD(P)/FAD-dependent oxidoreductase [Bryobacteraceae bacterium]|nr:NAD(P)/FAD-dependent oxidoreductase [Bryobacteraceae bacterium]
MDSCDILIVGGGPAGSSCAWRLRNSGLDVAILDKQVFPRDKVCGGWITPQVLTALDIDTAEYGASRVLQPITGFRIGCIGHGSPSETDYGEAVSYGIRRCEFDHYLLRRSSARTYEGAGLSRLERTDQGWIANGNLRARLVVGAGGHFCPVARRFRAASAETVVAAQETEFELEVSQQSDCPVRGTVPELYFCPDMKGYGWCFRKGNVLNIGLGRADSRRLPERVQEFVRFLGSTAGVSLPIPAMRGHAYLLYGTSPRRVAGDGFLLIGDAAGLAYPQSGEGILPAVESGLLAAETILSAQGNYRNAQLEPYARQIADRFGVGEHWATRIGRSLPPRLIELAAARLMDTRWFTRNVVLDRWFLHRSAA